MDTIFEDRFKSKFRINAESGCFEWIAGLFTDGYGLYKKDGKLKRAHRVAYESVYGPIPEGNVVCHTCDNPRCVNPEHLFAGTVQDNVNDKIGKGRQIKGSDIGNAILTEEKVLEIRSSNLKQHVLASMYGVNQTTISAIKTRKIWRHV